jgi:hypothetical protein
MDNILDISDLRKQFVEKTKLKDVKLFAEKQQEVIEKLLVENTNLKEKLNHLETIVKNLPVQSPVIKVPMTIEELICLEQIDLLKMKSKDRELSLDETKRLDIFIKNLRLIRNESTEVINTTNYSTVNEVELVAIATGKQNSTE